jgi:hydrogenase/urease accessory protein HupE
MTSPTFAPVTATAAFLALVPVVALAHEGHHEGMSAPVGLRHLLSQPDHLAVLAMVVALVGVSGWQVYRNRTPR